MSDYCVTKDIDVRSHGLVKKWFGTFKNTRKTVLMFFIYMFMCNCSK